jgi:putative ABC transport system permease protein
MSFAHEIRTSTRGLARTPGFFIFAALLLAAGVALTLYIFSAINGFFLRPLPWPEAERLAHLELADAEQRASSLEVPLPDYFALRETLTTVDGLSAFYSGTVNLRAEGEPERVEGGFTTVGLFDLLALRPALGRLFVAADEAPEAPPVAVLSHAVWQRRFGGDPHMIGRTLRLNTVPTTVVGVLPPEFRFTGVQEIWLPIRADRAAEPRESAVSVEIVGRLVPGASFDALRAEADAALARVAAADSSVPTTLTAVVKPFADEFVGPGARISITLMFVAVVLVLLIACADVANLLLVRGLGRQRDVAVRAALGAGRRRLVVQGLVEGGVIAAVACAAGLPLALWGGERTMELLRAAEGVDIPSWVTMKLDARVVAFTFVLAAAAALLASLGPALAGSRPRVLAELRGAGRGTQGSRLGRSSRALVVAQMALSVALLVCAGLAVRSVQKLAALDVGVDTKRLLGARIGLFEGNYPDDSSRLEFFRRTEETLRALPGVAEATVTTSLPASFIGGLPLEVEGVPLADFGGRRGNIARVSPSYFATLELPILTGRGLTNGDDGSREPVAVVNQSLARYFFGDRSPLDRRIRFASRGEPRPWIRIVGVVPDVIQDELDEGIKPAFYVPIAQDVPQFAFLAVRAAGDPRPLGPAIARAVAAIDPDQPVYWLRTVEDWRRIGSFMNSFQASLFTLFAAAGLLLAGAGLYGVLAFNVASRTGEIGVRRALGAADRGIVAWIARGNVRDLALGLGLGAVVAGALARPLAGLFYDVEAFDALTWLAIPLVLGITTLLAALVPTLRALRVEPAVALRQE